MSSPEVSSISLRHPVERRVICVTLNKVKGLKQLAIRDSVGRAQ